MIKGNNENIFLSPTDLRYENEYEKHSYALLNNTQSPVAGSYR